MLYREMVAHKGQWGEAMKRMLAHFACAGNELGNLLPQSTKYMWKLIQDVFSVDIARSIHFQSIAQSRLR